MQEAVKHQIRVLGADWHDGDVIVANHPAAGGSHLPDITVITAVFAVGAARPVFYVASRGHHADIGGIYPGSMPPFSKHLFEEGAAIESFKLVARGAFDEAGITRLLMAPAAWPGCAGARNLSDNLSDLRAQVAANTKGIRLMHELIAQYSLPVVQTYMRHIQRNAERAVRDMLREFAARKSSSSSVSASASSSLTAPPSDATVTFSATDHLDDGSPIVLTITIDPQAGSAVFDFAGTGAQLYGNLNAPKSVTYSAVIYCLRCLVQVGCDSHTCLSK
jgi:5-oxoprolinase (ATP-hydrolysing)